MGWSQLLAIIKTNEKEAEKEMKSCPNCGNKLTKTKKGRWCDFCGWIED